MLDKLMDNLQNNKALKNLNVRDEFKLDLIVQEQDLH